MLVSEKILNFDHFANNFGNLLNFFVLSQCFCHSGHPHPVLLMDFVTSVAWPEEDCHGFPCYPATASTTIVPCSLFLQVKTHTEGQNKPFLTDNINIRGQNMTISTLMAPIKLKSFWEIHLKPRLLSSTTFTFFPLTTSRRIKKTKYNE